MKNINNYDNKIIQTKISIVNVSSGYSPFSDGVGLPLHNIPSSGVLMKSIGAEFFRSYAIPGINHMCHQTVFFIVPCNVSLHHLT